MGVRALSVEFISGDLMFELLGAYPATEYFGIEEQGTRAGNSQTARIFVKQPLTNDLLEKNLYLVSEPSL